MEASDAHCLSLVCLSAAGAMDWATVFMFALCALILGVWVGFHLGRWYQLEIAFDVNKAFRRNLRRVSGAESPDPSGRTP
jgi:membrane protein DedA with SNARE-associated domain